jgi:hypothetical protein
MSADPRQLTLDRAHEEFISGYDIRPVVEPVSRAEQIDAAFRAFHAASPQVWELFVRFTLDVIRRGFEHYSADAILHRVRWHTDVEAMTDEGFKINNNYSACYSRRFHSTYPEYAGFFRERDRTSSAVPAWQRKEG